MFIRISFSKFTSIANRFRQLEKEMIFTCTFFIFFNIDYLTKQNCNINIKEFLFSHLKSYELATAFNNPDYLLINLNLREKGTYIHNSVCFGLPLIYMVPKAKLTHGQLYQQTLKVLR